MKQILHTLVAVVIALAGLAACSSETLVDESPLPQARGNSITVHIAGLAPATRATPAPDASNPKVTQTPALDREKAIADGRLYAVVFGSDGGFRKLVQAVKLAEASYNFDMGQAGTFDLRLVANPDDALVAKLGTIASATQLDALVASQSPGDNNQATHFLMTSAKTQVTTVAGQSTDAGTIRLERVAARIDLFNRIELLKMTRITFKNRYAESRLSRGAANLAMTGLAAPASKAYAAAEGLTDYDCIGAIYGYENMEVGNTVLTLEATYNGKPIGTHDIVVGGVPVKRNHLYSIVISAKGGSIDPGDVFGSLKFDIVVNDWQEGATLEWKDGDLINKDAPNFTVAGTNITTLPAAVGSIAAQNPTEIHAPQSATDITVSVVAYSSAGSTLQSLIQLPAGYSITPGAVGDKDGKLTQEFTIHLADNSSVSDRSFSFVLANGFNPMAKREFTVTQLARPKMALEYVAEYNISTTPGVFTNSHDNDKSGYYNWQEARTIPMPAGYHMPNKEELVGIVSAASASFSFSSLEDRVFSDQEETITVKGNTQTYTADYSQKKGPTRVSYALRFKGNGNTMLAAYRYEYVGDYLSEVGKLTTHLKITARYLGSGFTGTVTDIDNEAFWTSNNAADVTRVFPACGYFHLRGVLESFGQWGAYWSTTDYTRIEGFPGVYNIGFSLNDGGLYNFLNDIRIRLTLRPFSDN